LSSLNLRRILSSPKGPLYVAFDFIFLLYNGWQALTCGCQALGCNGELPGNDTTQEVTVTGILRLPVTVTWVY
jgi:hypothetical protein